MTAHKTWSKDRLAETVSSIRSGARLIGVKGVSWLPDGMLQDVIEAVIARIDQTPTVDTTDTPANGEVLTYDSGSGKYKPSPSGSAAVSSVFTRTGAVTAAGGDYSASQVTNTPAGNIAATTVQAAINELDSEKLSSVSASGVSNTPAGNIAATTVQAALNELDSEKASQPFPDNTALVKNNTDATKLIRLNAASVATGTTRVLTMPNHDVTLDQAVGVFLAYMAGNKTVSADVNTKLNIDTEEYDTNGWFDSATNYRFTPLLAGFYLFILASRCTSAASGNYQTSLIYKNGAQLKEGPAPISTGASQGLSSDFSVLAFANGSTDYFELWGRTNTTTVVGGATYTYFQAFYVGA